MLVLLQEMPPSAVRILHVRSTIAIGDIEDLDLMADGRIINDSPEQPWQTAAGS